jgi:ATP-dependent RNA helicase HelY
LESAPGLTPGDFVRAIKQLMDLLDQIAAAAGQDPPVPARAEPSEPEAEPSDPALRRGRGVAATARAAIDAMRRGVVAYTTLAE